MTFLAILHNRLSIHNFLMSCGTVAAESLHPSFHKSFSRLHSKAETTAADSLHLPDRREGADASGRFDPDSSFCRFTHDPYLLHGGRIFRIPAGAGLRIIRSGFYAQFHCLADLRFRQMRRFYDYFENGRRKITLRMAVGMASLTAVSSSFI